MTKIQITYSKEKHYMPKYKMLNNEPHVLMPVNHFRDKDLSLKAIGLLSIVLSLPEDWDYSVKDLVTLSSDGYDSVSTALRELEAAGYLTRKRVRDSQGKYGKMTYMVNPKPDKTYLNDENKAI